MADRVVVEIFHFSCSSMLSSMLELIGGFSSVSGRSWKMQRLACFGAICDDFAIPSGSE